MSKQFDQVTIADVARYPRPGAVMPGRLGFTPDSQAVTYLMSGEGNLVRSLWRHDIASGERTVLAGPPPKQTFSRDEELRRERMRLREEGVTDYFFANSAAEPVLAVPAGGAVSVSRDGGPLLKVEGTDGAIDPRLNPDGTKLGFVREGDLYVADLLAETVERLTFDAVDGLTNGLAEFMAQEELDRSRGFWWSPDGRKIAFIQADERHIPLYPIVHQGKDEVDVENHRYPFAGAPNARLRLGVVDVASRAIAWREFGEDDDIYIASVAWTPAGQLTVQVLNRAQDALSLYGFAGGERELLIEERTAPWLNLSHQERFLDGGDLLWSSERTGYRHLYRYRFGASGAEVLPLTAGDWVVTSVVGVDEERRLVYFTATKESPVERHVYRVSLEGGAVERLTSGAGTNDGVLSRDGRKLLLTTTSRDHAPSVALRDLESSAETTIFANEGASSGELGLTPPDLFTLPAADGRTVLYGALYRPVGMAAGAKAPLVVSVYGGPHAQRVIDAWGMTVDMRAQYLARQGCAVLVVDNRGSANRGLAFEGWLHLRMGTVEVDDQTAAVAWAAKTFDFIDPARVGVYGWSYGGYMTLLCLLKQPDVFKVGVAGAPVTHWDGYDTAYTERYMSTPQLNPHGYRDGSPLTHVAALRGQLLVVHGMIDENVHFRHTARLVKRLADESKAYELLIYPEERHMPRDQKGLEDQESKVLGFLLKNLGIA
ncbi:MAG: S9 family peptidase [Dehalococcoidia bacterium]